MKTDEKLKASMETNAALWPKWLVLEMNLFLLTHPEMAVQRLFEEKVASRLKLVSLNRSE